MPKGIYKRTEDIKKLYRHPHKTYKGKPVLSFEVAHQKLKETALSYKKKLRIACLSFYGGNPPKCNCCKENTYEFLAIDHINGGGNKHKKERGCSSLYAWLVRNNFPDGFQVLCHNCNLAKGFYGACPHTNNKVT